MNVLDRNLDGCCVRGLPIGRPFRARFEVPKDYNEVSFLDTTDVFILLRYKDMQGGEVLDLTDHDKQDLPSETKENTLKRRILNRQNLTKEKSFEKQESDNEEESSSDVESVTIEGLFTLHVDSETWSSYYSDPTGCQMNSISIEPDGHQADFFDTGKTVIEVKSEQQTEIDEETLSGTNKIIHALFNRQTSEGNTVNEEAEHTNVLINNFDSSMSNEDKIVEEKTDVNLETHSKRKLTEEAIDVKKSKLKKIEETDNESRRVSQRLRSVGYRPDYKAMEKSVDTYGNNCKNDDDTDSYDVDDDSIDHGKEDMVTNIPNQKKLESSVEKPKTESVKSSQDEKPDLKKLQKIISSPCASNESRKVISKRGKQSKIKDKARRSDTEVAKNNAFENGTDSAISNEIEPDPNDPDFKLKGVKKVKTKKTHKLDHENEGKAGKLKKKVKRKHAERENDTPDKPKRQRKPKDLKSENTKSKKAGADDSSLVESDPDLSGLAGYKRSILIARRRKILEQQEKRATRIKVKLHEHTDKWKKDVMDSYMRKDRGKARYEVAVEMYVCTVCDKYKAESKESMENHIEMHVNGDLQCNHPNCSFIAVTNFELQKHKRDVHKKNIWICDICGVETIGKEGLRDHIGRVHDSPQWSCKLCTKDGKKFASVTLHEYKKHLRAAHPDSMFRCDGCKRLFAQQHKLDNHLKLGCEGEGRKAYSCEKCGKVFSSHDSVKRHIMRVHNRERSFQCPYCPFTAARQTNLTSHLNVHEGYHPFKCDQCTFSCVQKYQLKSHMRTHSGEKPYKCTQCNYAAAWNVQLKDHMKAHSLPNAVCCDPCNIMFKDIRALKTHETKEHGLTSVAGSQKETKIHVELEPGQIVVDNANSTYSVPQTYAQVINFSSPYIPSQNALPYLAHYAAPFE